MFVPAWKLAFEKQAGLSRGLADILKKTVDEVNRRSTVDLFADQAARGRIHGEYWDFGVAEKNNQIHLKDKKTGSSAVLSKGDPKQLQKALYEFFVSGRGPNLDSLKVAASKQAYNKYNPIDTFSLFINALRNEKMGFPPEAKELAKDLSKTYGKQIMEIWTDREK